MEKEKNQPLDNIKFGLHLTPEYAYKIVTEIPPFLCRNYDNEIGFRVQVGEKAFINIPLSMLETLFNSSLSNNNIYNSTIFKNHYPKQKEQKPCHVHSVGKLFEYAGIMEQIDSRNYRIII